MRELLEKVVSEGGGKNAYIEGYRVGGKTGTAQVYIDGKVSSSVHIGSFIGFAPADALPCLLRQLREELPAGAGEVSTDRGQRLRLEYQTDLPDGTRAQKRIFLLPESLFPESAELYLGGALQLTLQMEEFSLTPREPVASAPELWYTESVTAFVGRA